MNGAIAVEEHFVTEPLADLITPIGWSRTEWSEVIRRLSDVDRRMQEMDRLGIATAVLSLGAGGIQVLDDARRARHLAATANDFLAELSARSNGRFAGWAALPLQDPDAALRELDRAILELGLKGVLVNGYTSSPQGALYYDDPRYEALWQRLEDLQVPLYLHPRNPPPDQRRIYDGRPELLGPTWAFGVETATHALRLVMSGLFDRHPRLTVILGHLGELLPFAVARLDERWSRLGVPALSKSPSQVLRENFYISTSGAYTATTLQAAVAEMGAERVLFATDYPFEPMPDGVHRFESSGLPDAVREQIGRHNPASLLRLRAPASP